MMLTHLTRLAALCTLVSLAPASPTQNKLVVKAGRVITQAGAELENGVILIENGRIKAVGADVEVPWDATVIEEPDMVAFPGFIEAHSNSGMDRTNENIDVTPFLSVVDSIDPVNFYFEDSLRWGVTTINVQQGNNCVIAAQGLVVKPHGRLVDEMLVRPGAGIKLSAAPKRGHSRATQAHALREAFSDLRRYLEDAVKDKRDGGDHTRREALFQGRELEGEEAKGRAMEGSAWKVEGLELVPRGEIDEKQEPLLRLVEGKLPAFIYCAEPIDVHRALEIARDNGFLARTTLVCSSNCWKAADVIAEAGVPVVLEGRLVDRERDPITGDEIETFVPGVLRDKGVRFALSSENSTTQSLWYQAAQSVGLGLTRAEALAAVTTTPAEILGLGQRLGSLEVGKDGNVVLFSGDPLSVSSFVERVVLEGELVYDKREDIRMRQLLEGQTPPGTTANALEGEGVHEHAEEGGEPDEPEEPEEPEEPDPEQGGGETKEEGQG
jgi:imidazolonepropionase-like amidohydrolase